MALLDDVPGVEVQIVVQDQVLHEYQDRSAQVSAKTTERYVEAQSHAEFQIRYAFSKPFPADRPVSMIVTIDGKDVDEPLIRPFELFEPQGHFSHGPISSIGSRWMVQKYCFSPIDIREDGSDTVPDDVKKALQAVGTITCTFYFLNNPIRNRYLRGAHKDMCGLPSVSEKAVKGDALSHQATLSASSPTEEVEYYDAEYANNGEPFATFHFYYRSLPALKALHIIDRTPEPLEFLHEDNTPLGQMNREQLEAIVRRLREREDNRLRIKRERSSSATLVGDAEDVGDGGQCRDVDFVELRSVDLRAQRRAKRVRQVPMKGAEVIELDG